jgi:hypothetical protein
MNPERTKFYTKNINLYINFDKKYEIIYNMRKITDSYNILYYYLIYDDISVDKNILNIFNSCFNDIKLNNKKFDNIELQIEYYKNTKFYVEYFHENIANNLKKFKNSNISILNIDNIQLYFTKIITLHYNNLNTIDNTQKNKDTEYFIIPDIYVISNYKCILEYYKSIITFMDNFQVFITNIKIGKIDDIYLIDYTDKILFFETLTNYLIDLIIKILYIQFTI